MTSKSAKLALLLFTAITTSFLFYIQGAKIEDINAIAQRAKLDSASYSLRKTKDSLLAVVEYKNLWIANRDSSLQALQKQKDATPRIPKAFPPITVNIKTSAVGEGKKPADTPPHYPTEPEPNLDDILRRYLIDSIRKKIVDSLGTDANQLKQNAISYYNTAINNDVTLLCAMRDSLPSRINNRRIITLMRQVVSNSLKQITLAESSVYRLNNLLFQKQQNDVLTNLILKVKLENLQRDLRAQQPVYNLILRDLDVLCQEKSKYFY